MSDICVTVEFTDKAWADLDQKNLADAFSRLGAKSIKQSTTQTIIATYDGNARNARYITGYFTRKNDLEFGHALRVSDAHVRIYPG